MTEPTPFERDLLSRFSGSVAMPGGEVWVRYEDAVAAVDLAQERGLNLLGLEGFVVGESVYPSMSRIADFSRSGYEGSAYDDARALLTGSWAEVPDDLHTEAEGIYMIDVVVDDRLRLTH
jgi:hypothetical protein